MQIHRAKYHQLRELRAKNDQLRSENDQLNEALAAQRASAQLTQVPQVEPHMAEPTVEIEPKVEPHKEVVVMAEEAVTPAASQEVKPGETTSEYRLTKVLVAIGTALQGLGAILATLPQDTKWVAIVTAVCGTALQVLSVLGYVKGRSQVKAAASLASPRAASASGQPSAQSSP